MPLFPFGLNNPLLFLSLLSNSSGLIWSEIKQLWELGLADYLSDMWNILDFITNSLYVATITLRVIAYLQVRSFVPIHLHFNLLLVFVFMSEFPLSNTWLLWKGEQCVLSCKSSQETSIHLHCWEKGCREQNNESLETTKDAHLLPPDFFVLTYHFLSCPFSSSQRECIRLFVFREAFLRKLDELKT
jgi:hypothetical protein